MVSQVSIGCDVGALIQNFKCVGGCQLGEADPDEKGQLGQELHFSFATSLSVSERLHEVINWN